MQDRAAILPPSAKIFLHTKRVLHEVISFVQHPFPLFRSRITLPAE